MLNRLNHQKNLGNIIEITLPNHLQYYSKCTDPSKRMIVRTDVICDLKTTHDCWLWLELFNSVRLKKKLICNNLTRKYCHSAFTNDPVWMSGHFDPPMTRIPQGPTQMKCYEIICPAVFWVQINVYTFVYMMDSGLLAQTLHNWWLRTLFIKLFWWLYTSFHWPGLEAVAIGLASTGVGKVQKLGSLCLGWNQRGIFDQPRFHRMGYSRFLPPASSPVSFLGGGSWEWPASKKKRCKPMMNIHTYHSGHTHCYSLPPTQLTFYPPPLPCRCQPPFQIWEESLVYRYSISGLWTGPLDAARDNLQVSSTTKLNGMNRWFHWLFCNSILNNLQCVFRLCLDILCCTCFPMWSSLNLTPRLGRRCLTSLSDAIWSLPWFRIQQDMPPAPPLWNWWTMTRIKGEIFPTRPKQQTKISGHLLPKKSKVKGKLMQLPVEIDQGQPRLGPEKIYQENFLESAQHKRQILATHIILCRAMSKWVFG